MVPQPQLAPVNAVLTAFGVHWLQNQDKFIAEKVFPWRPVPNKTGRYNFYTLDDTLRDEIGELVGTAESPEVGFSKTQKTYRTRRFGGRTFENDDLHMEWSGGISVAQAITANILGKAAIRCEKMWHDSFMRTGVWGKDFTGQAGAVSSAGGVLGTANLALAAPKIRQWDQDGTDFIRETQELCDYVESRSGFRPNTMVMGPYAYTKMVNMKFYRDLRAENVQWREDKTKLEDTLRMDNIYVPRAVMASSGLGAKKDNIKIDFIGSDLGGAAGKSILLAYVEPNPSPLTPTAGVTFTTRNNMARAIGGGNIMGFGVYRYVDQSKHSLVVDVRANWQHAVIAPQVAIYLKDIVS